MNLSQTFGPMSKTNCDYFLLLSMIGALVMLMTLVFSIFKYKKNKSLLIVVLSILQPFVIYFQNRLLYNMCVNSI